MKRCSTSLIIREIQIKTTMRYYLVLIRMTTIKTYKKNKTKQNQTLQKITSVDRMWRM